MTRQRKPNFPETYGALLLQIFALITEQPLVAPRAELVDAAIGFLMSFDLYARSRDLIHARRSELRAPRRTTAGRCVITVYPSRASREQKGDRSESDLEKPASKTKLHDVTSEIGVSPERV